MNEGSTNSSRGYVTFQQRKTIKQAISEKKRMEMLQDLDVLFHARKLLRDRHKK